MKNTQEIKPLNSETIDNKQSIIKRVKSKKSGGMVFVPGQSGNPAGRPKGTKNFSTLMDLAVKDISKANKITEDQVWQVLIKKGYSEASRGNFQFYKDILDRYFGEMPKFITPTINIQVNKNTLNIINNAEKQLEEEMRKGIEGNDNSN